jgi:hypothetical protein
MTGAPLIGLLDGLLSDLATVSTGPPMVLPVVHDALEPDRPVVEATVARYDGVVLRGDDYFEPALGNPPAEFVEIVRATCERHGLNIEVILDGGTVHVRAPNEGTPNPPLRSLLRVCELLLSDAARQNDLVVVSIPTQGLEDRRLALLWELAVIQIPPHLPATVRAFVPIWEGSVDVRRHCTGTPSMRYAVQSGRLVARRGGEVALDAGVARILRARDQPLVLFLGAGFSRSARLPLGDAVRDDAIADVLGRPLGSDGLHEAFRRWVIDQDRLMEGEESTSAEVFSARLTLERVLREEFHNLREEGRQRDESRTVQRLQADCRQALERVPDARVALRRLAAALPRLIVLTVNFDRLIEHELGVECRVFAAPGEFADGVEAVAARLSVDGGPLPVVKLHGDIERPDTIVADVDQTRFGLPADARQLLDTIVERSGIPVPWVWLGCSMRDLDVDEWSRDQNGHRDLFEWWVDPLPGPTLNSYWQRFRRKDQYERDIDYERQRLLPETGDRFLTALADAADGMG